jgi:sugar phosphate isomerase/epimerase
MTAPIAIQLYSVRENLAKDFEGTMRKIAQMGFKGVETAGFPEGVSPDQAKRTFDDLGLVVAGSHSPLPIEGQKQAVLDTLAAIDCPHLVCPWMNPEYFASKDKLKELADILNEVYEIADANGLQFSYHNHEFEYAHLNGAPAIYHLQDYLKAGIGFELDTYWIQVAGQDPAEVTSRFGRRAPLLHIKDGPATKQGDMTAVGDGVVDVPAIISAGKPNTEWLIVELDRCATDMMEAVEKSLRYLDQISNTFDD